MSKPTSTQANQTASKAQCLPCSGIGGAMTRDNILKEFDELNASWLFVDEPDRIQRRFEFKGFRHAMLFTNAVAWIADQEGHHPDMRVGYNYVEITFTTHEAGGVTPNDFVCAREVDQIFGSLPRGASND